MKKILILIVLISSLFALAACQSQVSQTKVRVVSLSYRSSETELEATPSNSSMRLLSNKLLADEVVEYIFPGDLLTFTVELEDPNFEFISLLSIKFNDQIIRANSDDSIFKTRDCGANICVDFQYEISADESEYSVQEVKFAKLNSDSGVNAIIDNQTSKTVILDIFKDEVSPYMSESLNLINEILSNLTFENPDFGLAKIVNDENFYQFKQFENYLAKSNSLYIVDYHGEPLQERIDLDGFRYIHYDVNSYIGFIDTDFFTIDDGWDYEIDTSVSNTILFLGIYSANYEYLNIYAVNEGNKIYIQFEQNGTIIRSIYLIELSMRTRFLPIVVKYE